MRKVDIAAPFSLCGKKLPFTLFEAVKFLKNKSNTNISFASIMSYIFADLGIVIYPYTVIDIEAGIKSTFTTHRLALCNNEVLKRYFSTFVVNYKQNDHDPDIRLVEQIGRYLEEHGGEMAD